MNIGSQVIVQINFSWIFLKPSKRSLLRQFSLGPLGLQIIFDELAEKKMTSIIITISSSHLEKHESLHNKFVKKRILAMT